jgi:acid phosphatase (class A)
MEMKKLLLIAAAVLMMASLIAQQDEVKPYFSVEELPDLVKCLPAPPDFDSPEFANDVVRYQWGKAQRLDSARAAIAKRDAVWSYEALLAEFNIPFGLEISRTGTPEIWKLLETSLVTTDQMRVAPKAYYHRLRPFEMYDEHLLSPETEEELRGEGSYPSGHTARGWLAALLLAEINPARADTIFARGWMYGESRVIEGAHWQSDVDVTRAAASIGYAALQSSAAFREQMEKAKAEFDALTKKPTHSTKGTKTNK